MRLYFLVAAAAILMPVSPLHGRPLALPDLELQVTVSSPRPSPDGRKVVALVGHQNFEDNRFDSSLVLIDVATGDVRHLTPRRHNVSAVAWSPDGKQIAFIDRQDPGPPQLFVLPVAGGKVVQVTRTALGVGTFAWRPDGQAFAFTTPEAPQPLDGVERHNRSFEVQDQSYLDRGPLAPSQLWIIPASGGKAQQLTSGRRSILGIAWTPDSRGVVMTAAPSAQIPDYLNASLMLRDLDRGTESILVEQLQKALPTVDALSPDGQWLAWLSFPDPERTYGGSKLCIVNLATGEIRQLATGLDRELHSVAWNADSKTLVAAAPDRTRSRMWLLSIEGQVHEIPLGRVDAPTPREFGVDLATGQSGALAFVGSTPTRPAEVYYAATVRDTPRQLTRFNESLGQLDSGRVETVEWEGPDGHRLNGVLTYPPGHVAGRKLPLVLQIHGGPMDASIEGWDALGGLPRMLAAQGWLVFSPNYRGSNNMGRDFKRAIVNDAGDGPARDIMSGVEVLKARGIVDESRMAVSGWSYGGYMTVWLSAHYPVWRAAVAGAAVTDQFDQYSLSELTTIFGYGFGGSPWLEERIADNRRQSPISNAHRIKAPTLILANLGDTRVPVTQSFRLYHALKDNGTPVKFVAYPTPGHGPSDPVHQRDMSRRWIDWIRQHFE